MKVRVRYQTYYWVGSSKGEETGWFPTIRETLVSLADKTLDSDEAVDVLFKVGFRVLDEKTGTVTFIPPHRIVDVVEAAK